MYYNSSQKRSNQLQGVGDSVLQAILDDASDKLYDLISDHISDTTDFFLPDISKRLPEFLYSNPSLLSISCFFASTNCFRLLLSVGSNADTKDSKGRTAIHFAAAGGSLEMMRELDQHLQITKNDDQNTSSQNSTHSSSDNDFVIKNDVYNYYDSYGKTPMNYAAQFGRLDIIKYLYLKGAKLDSWNSIRLACLYGHVDVVRFLVENGVSLTDDSIHRACIGGDAATIEYLISQKVDLNGTDGSNTPLCYAAKYGSLNAIKVLLKHKAAFKIRGRKNFPIKEAILNGHLDVVRFFIEQGCDPNLYDSAGKSILYLAIEDEQCDIVKYLLSRGATVFPDGRYAKKTENRSLPKLRTSKSKSHSKCKYQDPISLASSQNGDMLLLLLDHIDINEYLNDHSEPDSDDSPEKRKNLIFNSFIKIQSEKLLDILLEHKIIEGDCTDIYYQVIDAKSDKAAISMLDKKVPFNSTSELIRRLIEFGNQPLFNKFLDAGLQLSQYNIQEKAFDAIYSFNVNTIKFLLESKQLLSNGNYASIEFSSDELNSSKIFNYINAVLNAAIMFPPQHISNCQSSFYISSSTRSQSVSTNRTNLIEICKLFLNHGFTFSSDDHQIFIPSNLTSEQANLLLELLNLIEKSCPNSLDFSKYTIDQIEKLLYNLDNNVARQLLDFFFLHNFSFKSREDRPKFDDLHLILTILLPNSNSNTWTSSYNDSSGPYEPTRNQSDYQQEQKYGYNYGFINNSFNRYWGSNPKRYINDYRDPDLKLIYYLFDHDYILSSRSLNAIVKYGLKSNNHELIHRAFQHCDLSNEPIITKFGPIYCKTALEIACKNGLVDIAKELIERGANVNEGGYNNRTSPLYYALTTNNEKLTELLKSKGAILIVGPYKSLQPQFYKYQLQQKFHSKYGRKTQQKFLIY